MRTNVSSAGFLYFPYHVADEAGMFADNGVEVELVEAGAGAMPSLVAGESDMAMTAANQVFALRDEGRDIVAWGAIDDEYATHIVIQGEIAAELGISAESSPEERAAALQGLRIGTSSPGAGADLLVRGIMSREGLDPESDAQIIYVESGAAAIAAFAQDRIDAFAFSSPTATQAIAEHDGEMLFNLTQGDYPDLSNFLYVVFASQADWLEENRDTAGCFLRAIETAMQLIEDDPQQAREVAMPAFGDIDPELYERGFEESRAAWPITPEIDPEAAQTAYDFDVEVRNEHNPLEEHIDNSIAEEYLS